MWWIGWACTTEQPTAPPPPAPAPEVPVRVDRRTAGPCDPAEMLGALRAAGMPVEGATAGDALCQGRFGRVVVTTATGERVLGLLKYEAAEWKALDFGPELGPASCEQISSMPTEVCQEMLTQPR